MEAKSKIIFTALIMFSSMVQAQMTHKIFLDKNGHPTDSLSAESYAILISLDSSRTSVIVESYYKSGQLESRVKRTSDEFRVKPLNQGPYFHYYEDGTLMEHLNYKDDKLDGVIKTYYNSGKLRREDIFKDNELIKGQCFGTFGQDTTYFPYFKPPQFPTGYNDLIIFINTRIKYPEKARRRGEEGIVVISFLVNENGSIKDIRVNRGISKLLDAEALRVAQLLPNFVPAEKEGIKISYRYIQPVVFKLVD